MTSLRLGGAVLAAAAMLSIVPGTAVAADHPSTSLTLTVTPSRGPSTTVRLHCQPAWGSHPEPRLACDAMRQADGDFDNLPGYQQFAACTMEFRPMIASARGTWHGDRVRWKHKFANPCTLRSATGVVFDF
jgi:hypothetical protein